MILVKDKRGTAFIKMAMGEHIKVLIKHIIVKRPLLLYRPQGPGCRSLWRKRHHSGRLPPYGKALSDIRPSAQQG